MNEKQPKYGKMIAERADPARVAKAFEEHREAVRIDAQTGRTVPPPVIPVEWPDAFPQLPR